MFMVSSFIFWANSSGYRSSGKKTPRQNLLETISIWYTKILPEQWPTPPLRQRPKKQWIEAQKMGHRHKNKRPWFAKVLRWEGTTPVLVAAGKNIKSVVERQWLNETF